jgi:hypothetical protein
MGSYISFVWLEEYRISCAHANDIDPDKCETRQMSHCEERLVISIWFGGEVR